MRYLRNFLILIVALGGCTKPTPTPVTPVQDADAAQIIPVGVDAATVGPELQACQRLADLKCKEGLDPNCAAAIIKLESIYPINTSCLTAAGSIMAIRNCGVTCTVVP